MWKLAMRGPNRNWTDLGAFDSINAAARRVVELEDEPLSSLFFRVYADPPMGKSDAEILSRLEYQGTKGFYLLTRQLQ